jgi:LPS export ABC transporter protein LptC
LNQETSINKHWTIILLICVTLCVGCTDVEDMAQTAESTGDSLPDQILIDSEITDSRDGSRSWVLNSSRSERWKDVDDAQLYDVDMDFYKADTLHSTLTSERGRANLKTQDLFAWGNVVIVTKDGRRLETEELNYDDGTGLISNDVFNRFTKGQDVMTGVGMEATPDLNNFELKSDVTAHAISENEDTQ